MFGVCPLSGLRGWDICNILNAIAQCKVSQAWYIYQILNAIAHSPLVPKHLGVTPPPTPPLGGEGSKAEKRCPAPPSLVGKGAGGLGQNYCITALITALLHIQQLFDQLLYRAGFCLDPDFQVISLTSRLGVYLIGFDHLSLHTCQKLKRNSDNSKASSNAGFTHY